MNIKLTDNFWGRKIFVVIFAVIICAKTYGGSDKYDKSGEAIDSLRILLLQKIQDVGLDRSVLQSALKGWYQFRGQELLKNDTVITIIDFDKPSTEERLFILDIKNQCLLHKSLVAHGKFSGANLAESFSNTINSNQSSPGFYLTAEQYYGKHGLSMRLDGLEPSINSNARERNIVIHSAKYVSFDFIKQQGRLGRSFGCPALPRKDYHKVITILKQPSLLFIYTSRGKYLANSSVLNSNH